MTERNAEFDGLLRVTIANARQEAIDVRRFDLVREDRSPLPPFAAGAHIDVLVHLPDRTRALRSYSIASPPGEKPDHYTIAILCEENGTGGSIFLHERVRSGYIIEISPPKNFFELVDGSESSVLIAGGIGITPLLAMCAELSVSKHPFELHYAAKSPEHMAFRDLIDDTYGDFAHLYFDGGDPSRGMNIPAILGAPLPDRHAYICGPKGLIQAVRDTAGQLGWAEANIHYEIFTAPEPLAGDATIEVVAQKSGVTVQVAADTSILDALEQAGVSCDYECRMGICGTCAVKIIEGEPAHRDEVLLSAEKSDGLICTCVSRATSPRLVLDL